MSRSNITVDHDEIKQYVTELRAVADDIEHTIAAQTGALMADLRDEAGQGTTDGKPAPIFTDTLSAMQTACDALNTNAAQLVTNLRADADFLETALRQVQQVDDDGAAAVSAVGTPGPTTGPTDSGWDTPWTPPVEAPWTPGDTPSREVPVDPEVMQRDQMDRGRVAPLPVAGTPIDLPRYNI